MRICPLCESTEQEVLYTNSRGNKYLENYVCDDCGFIFTYPRISNEEINKLYVDGNFSKEARKSPIPDLNKFIQTETFALERLHLLEKNLPDFFSSKKTCLEIGCGTGSFSWLLKSRGHNILGLEPDSTFVNVAVKRYDIHVDTVLLDDFKTVEMFDFICNFHVIEHVLNPREFVKKMFKILKDDGVIYIECPTIDNIYTGDLNTFFWDVHVNTFSNKTLPWLLEREGFEIIEVFMNKGYLSVIAKKGKKIRFDKDDKQRIQNIVKNYTIKTPKKSFYKKFKTKLKNQLKKYLQ